MAFSSPRANGSQGNVVVPRAVLGALLVLAYLAIATSAQGRPIVPPPTASTGHVAAMAQGAPTLYDIKRMVENDGIDFDASFSDPKFVTTLPDDGKGPKATLPASFALGSADHSDNAASYDNCRVTLDFWHLNIPQRQGLPGYDNAGEAHSDVGYGECTIRGVLQPILVSFHGYVAVANCTDSPDISIGGTLYFDGPYGSAYTAAAFYISPSYGLTWGGFQSTAGHLSVHGVNMTNDNNETQGRCAGPPTTKMYTGGWISMSDGSGGENAASQNLLYDGFPYTAIDNGFPDPEDTATGSSGPESTTAKPQPVADALRQAGVDMSDVTIVNRYTAVMAANAMLYTQCPRLFTCFWQHANYRGRSLAAAVYQYGYYGWTNLRDFGLSDEVTSWRNRRSLTTYLDRDTGGNSGARVCLTRFSTNPRMYYFNDRASSFAFDTRPTC